MFKLKLHANGIVEIYKARLGEKGFAKTEGLDYLNTFSSVLKMTTIRVFMAYAAAQNCPLFHLYVNTVFLHGDINEEMYSRPLLVLIYLNLIWRVSYTNLFMY